MHISGIVAVLKYQIVSNHHNLLMKHFLVFCIEFVSISLRYKNINIPFNNRCCNLNDILKSFKSKESICFCINFS